MAWQRGSACLDLGWIRLSGKEFFETVAHTLGAEAQVGARRGNPDQAPEHLLSHVLEEKMEFSSYLGLDISQLRPRQYLAYG